MLCAAHVIWDLGGLSPLIVAVQKGRLHVHHNRILGISRCVIELIVGLACSECSQYGFFVGVLILADKPFAAVDAHIVFVLRIQPIIGKFTTLARAYSLSVVAFTLFILLTVINLLHNHVLLLMHVIVWIRGREVLSVIDQLLILWRLSLEKNLRLDQRSPTCGHLLCTDMRLILQGRLMQRNH